MENPAQMLREIMDATGWKQQRLAEELDVTQSSINRWLQGTRPLADSFQQITAIYRDKVGQKQAQTQVQSLSGSGIEVIGSIQAGNWLDTTLIDDDPNHREFIPVNRDERFPYARQYALEVRGDSMNLEFPEGSFVICVDYGDSGLSMKDGLVVHVERWQHGLREVTLKSLHKEDHGWRLEPRSSNPVHKSININGHSEDGTEVRIRGVVIGDYRRRRF